MLADPPELDTVNVPEFAPAAVGTKLTFSVQLAPPASVVHVFEETGKAAPLDTVTVCEVVEVFFTVTGQAALDTPTVCATPQFKYGQFNCNAVTPVPLTPMLTDDPFPLAVNKPL
jgi:hypothetical protein